MPSAGDLRRQRVRSLAAGWRRVRCPFHCWRPCASPPAAHLLRALLQQRSIKCEANEWRLSLPNRMSTAMCGQWQTGQAGGSYRVRLCWKGPSRCRHTFSGCQQHRQGHRAGSLLGQGSDGAFSSAVAAVGGAAAGQPFRVGSTCIVAWWCRQGRGKPAAASRRCFEME